MKPRIEQVFFDATDTLLQVKGSVGAIYASLAGEFGVELDATQVDANFGATIGQVEFDVAPGRSRAQILKAERDWWRQVAVGAVGHTGAFEDFGAYFDCVFEYFTGKDAWQLLPGARETLAHLRQSGYRLGIISNMDSRLYDILEAFELRHYFSDICLAFELGYAKPDPRLFEQAVRASGKQAAACCHVGDSLDNDVRPALRSGLRAVWLGHDHTAATKLPDGARRIDRLQHLPDVLRAG